MRCALPLVAAALSLPALLSAQGPTPEELQVRLDKVLAEEFVANAPWIQDLEAAKAAAKETGKPIFAYFTRSYAP